MEQKLYDVRVDLLYGIFYSFRRCRLTRHVFPKRAAGITCLLVYRAGCLWHYDLWQ